MIAKLLERNPKGINFSRWDNLGEMIVVSCAPESYLAASSYKAKGIPARVRVGFADWIQGEHPYNDHWITEYWDGRQNKWIQQDVDAIGSLPGFSWHDLPKGKFMSAGEAWNKVRSGQLKAEDFHHAAGKDGLEAIGWQLGFDIGNIMLNEPTYGYHPPDLLPENIRAFFENEEKLEQYDHVGKLLANPEENMTEIEEIWNRNNMFHCLK
jgi:excinuclease ABC subunit A